MRTSLRLTGFLGIVSGALMQHFVRAKSSDERAERQRRALWLHRWARRTLQTLGVNVHVKGQVPREGLIVSNHLGYLDVIVYAAVAPMVFLSKADVVSWPVIGRLTRCAGTLYVNRERRSDVVRAGEEICRVIEMRLPVMMFPEGTSSGGESVLPLRSSLLEPAVTNQWKLTPAWIGYELEEGSVAEEIAYWGEMTFASHLLNLFSKRNIQAKIHIGQTRSCEGDRKTLANTLREEIQSLQVPRMETRNSWAIRGGKKQMAKTPSILPSRFMFRR